MKKLERLQWIERTYGADVVSPYRVARTLMGVMDALEWHWFVRGDMRPGIRTDWIRGSEQGYNLPFLFPVGPDAVSIAETGRLVRESEGRLLYIVSGSVQPVLCQGVAERIDSEHIFVEINDREPEVTQRHMYAHPENLRQFVIGPSSRYEYVGRWFTCYKPEWCGVYALDRVYAAMFAGGADELTFSVKMNRRLIIW